MYMFEMNLQYNELFLTKTEMLNCKITVPLAKLHIVVQRLVSNGFIFSGVNLT